MAWKNDQKHWLQFHIFSSGHCPPPKSFGLNEARVFLSGEGLPGQKDAFGKPIKPGQPGQTGNPGQQGQPGQAGKPGQQGQPGQLGKPGQQVKPQQGDQQKPAGKTGKNGEPQNLTKMEIIKLKLKELKEKENWKYCKYCLKKYIIKVFRLNAKEKQDSYMNK